MLPLLLIALSQASPLTAQPPIVIPGGAGHFDFMSADPADRLIFACHPGKSSVTVINLRDNTVKDVDAGAEVNGVDVDRHGMKLYAAGGGKQLVQIDMKTWTRSNTLPLDGPGDDVIVDDKRGVVYVDNDDGTNVWVVDPHAMKVNQAITIKGAPEVLVCDSKRNKLFQNIKPTNTLQVIDPDTCTVIAEYTLSDVTSPHGLVEDAKTGRLFVAGRNGRMAILDADTGKLVSTIDVAKGSDQIAFDPGYKRVYVPGSGEMQVYEETTDGAKLIGSAPLPKRCHSVAVDPKTHDVWVVYADDTNSYAMKYVATK